MIIASRTQCVFNVKAVVAVFNQEKALVGAFSVITNLRMDFVWISSRYTCCCHPWPVFRRAVSSSSSHVEADTRARGVTLTLATSRDTVTPRLVSANIRRVIISPECQVIVSVSPGLVSPHTVSVSGDISRDMTSVLSAQIFVLLLCCSGLWWHCLATQCSPHLITLLCSRPLLTWSRSSGYRTGGCCLSSQNSGHSF